MSHPQKAHSASSRWVYGLFVASGFAGLLYEVVYAKRLGVTFGGTAIAAYTVMATYMGGMAFGAWLGGIIAERVRSPLRYYAIFEGVIGIYALFTPLLFQAINSLYLMLASDVRPDATYLTVWRVLLGALVLAVPTVLMGTTLPLMFKFLRERAILRAQAIAGLYTANIFGAATGALIAGYLIIPTLGVHRATLLAALLSLLIGLYALERLKHIVINTKSDFLVDTQSITAAHPRLGFAAVFVITIGGIVSLALEIVNMHLLAIIAGNSVYALGLMLATFLLGLGLGSMAYARLQNYLNDTWAIILAQSGLFFSIVVAAFQWDRLANYFASFAPLLQYFWLDFGAREIVRAVACAIIMIPSAFFIGFNYPPAMNLASAWLQNRKEAAGIGLASLCNTLGNIIGILLAGFVLLNIFGSNRTLLLLGVISLLLAIVIFWSDHKRLILHIQQKGLFGWIVTASWVIAVVLALLIYPAQWNLHALTKGSNVYFSPTNWGIPIEARESISGGLTTVNQTSRELNLLTNGKFQGNNSGEVQAQRSFALIPLLHLPSRGSALVIGYGTGASAHTLQEQEFDSIDIAELSEDVIELADKYFSDINGDVSQQPNVQIYYTDGRNFLLTQNKKYDLISMEITSIWFAGAANLYNQEFYHLAKERLSKDGVLQQWVQLHHMRKLDLINIINTVHREFKYVWLYLSGGQGVLVASNSKSSLDYHNLIGEVILDKDSLPEEERALASSLLLSPEDVDYISEKLLYPDLFTSTDSNLYLEYATPKGNALKGDALADNVAMLKALREERLKKEKVNQYE